ncbi:MAG: GLPGLI family protein [Flavobacterium sp.]|nr:GLPGLI family protein [Candidatus Neoflavobacterium equi]
MNYTALFFFCISTFAFAQTADTIVRSNRIKVSYKHYTAAVKESTYTSYLYVDPEFSQFVELREHKVFQVNENTTMMQRFVYFFVNYNYQTNQLEENRILPDGVVLYATWQPEFQWEITTEEKIIGNYRVRKAITDCIEMDPQDPYYSGKAIAWYSPDIPIPSGPSRYGNLPGLILKLEYEKNASYYLLDTIEPADGYEFLTFNTENEVEKEDVMYYAHKNIKSVKEIIKRSKNKK